MLLSQTFPALAALAGSTKCRNSGYKLGFSFFFLKGRWTILINSHKNSFVKLQWRYFIWGRASRHTSLSRPFSPLVSKTRAGRIFTLEHANVPPPSAHQNKLPCHCYEYRDSKTVSQLQKTHASSIDRGQANAKVAWFQLPWYQLRLEQSRKATIEKIHPDLLWLFWLWIKSTCDCNHNYCLMLLYDQRIFWFSS